MGKKSKKIKKAVIRALQEPAKLNNHPGPLIHTAFKFTSSKDRRHDGWITPHISKPTMKYSEIINQALEPPKFYDDWQNYRDGRRHNTASDQLYHKWKGCCEDVEIIYEHNNKLRKSIRIRKARAKR